MITICASHVAKCQECGGRGQIQRLPETANLHAQYAACPTCEGTGEVKVLCGVLLSVRCPAGHEHRPARPIDADVVAIWAASEPKCLSCNLPIDVREVSHGVCPECVAKMEGATKS